MVITFSHLVRHTFILAILFSCISQ
ncbi:hypothetical protein ACJIZ3_021742 [Penstemon smallii]|uniref:Uncharacterized protein n=1 Tax=Penstemon smallii TaxID=265156 RepID=A0ABD3SMH1_9LAMI